MDRRLQKDDYSRAIIPGLALSLSAWSSFLLRLLLLLPLPKEVPGSSLGMNRDWGRQISTVPYAQ